ncbi:MAG: phasin family protein [Desulfofundulus sp.]|uniref:phasin family protein n=1 Tax=Desulfofundulus sp. TaxID=2282750 RepID=UPI003C76874F
MFKTAERLILAGIGALALTTEKAEKIIDELAERGQMSKEEVRHFLQELIARGEQEKENLSETLRREVSRLRVELGLVTRSEIEELKNRICRLEEQLAKMENNSTLEDTSRTDQ